MHRQPATIVILAWNEWSATRACLDSLRPTLDLRDQVIVVDNGSVDQTPRGLQRYPWIEVVTNEENRGFAAGCNQGAALAKNDVVVFLNNDTLLVGHWLDALVEPFADETIGATGSRSNFVSGPQLVADVGYATPRHADIRRFEREWRKQHQGEVTDVDRLVGFCLAVRREAFEAIGGFDEGFGIGGFEDDDLCLRLLRAGHRLVIAHASFVHHDGHKTFDANGVDWHDLQQENGERFRAKHGRSASVGEGAETPLLSACLIVRDEEAQLPACLRSLEGVVDEIVVYDTGSNDATVSLARSAGAHVIEGYWDDDFARARNAALEACTGQWILHVDADEELVLDGDLRAELADLGVEALMVGIDNVDDRAGLLFSHTAIRMFRRSLGRWAGRLHEQVVGAGGAALQATTSTTARLRHWGYSAEAFATSDKHDRDIAIGRKAVADTGERDGQSLLNLARALGSAGNSVEALATFEKALARPLAGADRRVALRSVATLLIEMHRPSEALGQLRQLRRESSDTSLVDYLEGRAHAELDDFDRALQLLLPLQNVSDGDSYQVPRQTVLVKQGELCARAGRWDDAAARLIEAATVAPSAVPWATLANASWQAGDDAAGRTAALVGDSELLGVIAQLDSTHPAAIHALLDAFWHRFPGDRRLLAGATRYGASLDPEAAMEWSARLRSVGLEKECPLLAIATDFTRNGRDRLRATAILAGAFDLERARGVLPGVAATIHEEAFADCLIETNGFAPALLPALIELLASTPRRCAVLSELLREFGAAEEAAAIDEIGQHLHAARAARKSADGAADVVAPSAMPGVVVLGMHRSGTSAVARVLNLLGLRIAVDDDLMGAAPDNERGFWESRSLSVFNDELLQMLGGTWSAPACSPDGWENTPALRDLHQLARRRFHEVHGQDGNWVWKDPRACLTLPFWTSALAVAPVIVLAYRNPLDVWRSLERRDGFDKAHALALWERYVRSALAAAAGRPTLVTSYEVLLDDTEEWCERAGGFLTGHGLAVDVGRARAAVGDFLDQGLRHGRYTAADIEADEDLTPAQRALWARLEDLQGPHRSFDPGELPEDSRRVAPVRTG